MEGRGKMNDSERKGPQTEQPCIPCRDLPGGEDSCTAFVDYLTREEEEILALMRETKERATELKARMREIARELDPHEVESLKAYHDGPEKPSEGEPGELRQDWVRCQSELEELRRLWRELEKKKEEAHHRKMVLLGHRNP
jgi:cytochrome c553